MAYELGNKMKRKTWDQAEIDPKAESKKTDLIFISILFIFILLFFFMWWIKKSFK